MVEQNARQGLACSYRGYVLELGRAKIEGTAQDLLNSPEMAKLYLGGSTENHTSHPGSAKKDSTLTNTAQGS
jgi:ABC-type lipopolysaccharide export system ATPase subunit